MLSQEPSPDLSPEHRRGQQLMYHGFSAARPVWLLSSLGKLKHVWAKQAEDSDDKSRLALSNNSYKRRVEVAPKDVSRDFDGAIDG